MRYIPLLFIVCCLGAAERINHAGRVLGEQQTVTTPLLFNTAAADAVLASLQIMPRDNPWNERVDQLPVHASSTAIMARISSDLASNRQDLRMFEEMNFVLVPDGQALVDVRLVDYPDESDDVIPDSDPATARYPFADTTPIEGWPGTTGTTSLTDHQADVDGDGGDRHSIAVQPGTGAFWETWQTTRDTSRTPAWQASNGARFDLTTNALRPDGWTSADAAGLPMFPALVRYDEVQRGEIEHALRLIVHVTRRSYIYPATHYASTSTDADLPAMGQRLRLKSSVAIPESWSHEAKVVAAALQRYGALVADNGGFFSMSVCPDDRWPDGCFDDLRDLTIDDFEVVQSTAADQGPRSAGAPGVDAGADGSCTVGQAFALDATVSGSGTVSWALYRFDTAPGKASFADAAAASTTVSFDAVGSYRIMCMVDDGVHTPAYDLITVTVGSGLPRSLSLRLHDAAGGLPARVALDDGAMSPVDGEGRISLDAGSADLDHRLSFESIDDDG